MCCLRVKKNFEEHFPHHNWIIILSYQLLIVVIFSVMTPSIYQFVTSPRTKSENDEDDSKFWPGLRGSDSDYGWVVTAHPLFEAGMLPLTVATLYRLPFTFPLLAFACLAAAGGCMYALAQNVWFAFAGRALMGVGISIGAATVHTYLGEMGIKMDKIRQKQGKKSRKDLVYIAFSFTLNGGFVIPYALTSVIAMFKDVNPYRWPGWSVTALAAVVGISVILFFTETRSISRLKVSRSTMSCSCLTGLRLSAQLKTKSMVQYLTYSYVIACGFVVGMLYAFTFTLVTPILSDQFGFNVEYTSHFFICVSGAYLCSSFIHLGAKIAKMDNRYLLGLCLIFAVVGCSLVGDWQSIGRDPCHSTFEKATSDIDNNMSSTIDSGSGVWNCSVLPEGGNCSTSFTLYEQCCQSLSSSGHQCFFNPKSRITGEFCNTCLCSCLSEQATINLYQFSAGVLFLSLSAPLGFVFASAIASDITPVETQGLVVSLVIGSGAVGRAVTPLWFVKSYSSTGRHTYIAMAITAGCALVLLISLVFLFKNLAPINRQRDDNDLVVKATSKLAVIENDVSSESVVTNTVL